MIYIKYPAMLLGVILIVLVIFTSWYQVDESEQAIILTGGKVTSTVTNPGLKVKAPYPFQTVMKVSKETFAITFGYTEDRDGNAVPKVEESKMITGDENIVLADMVVQWRITDPTKYLFASQNPENILHNATSTALRSVIGSSKIDDALTTGKANIESKVRESLVHSIEKYDLGITIVATLLQDVALPTEEVKTAFKSVTDARENMNTIINEANKYKNEKSNEAQGTRDALISEAEGDKADRIGKAKGDVAVFNQLYAEYKKMPKITEDRLTLETMDLILGKAKVYITDGSSDTVKYLPLEQIKPKENETKQ